MTLEELNQLPEPAFVQALAHIFEDSPQVAQAVACQRPFASLEALHQAMVAVIQSWSAAEQLALICAHPDLGARVKMAPASVAEQAGAGLDRLSPEQFERFQRLNQTYRARFGFPYVVCVRQHTQESILRDYEQRIGNHPTQEQARALAEIAHIAWFRLQALLPSAPCPPSASQGTIDPSGEGGGCGD
ncbi:MAG: 2-oxo-4-hydroxy-4-carboxy-5-ureidoimidazoline decarboxylase [Thermostichales cyanobacterium BF4_bins_65]